MQWLYQFTFPPTAYKRSLFATSSPTFVTCVLFDDGHSDSPEVTPLVVLDSHFPDDERCCPSSHMPVGHLYVLLIDLD